MGKQYTNKLKFAASMEVRSAEPIDDRMCVADADSLTTLNTWAGTDGNYYHYKGMTVACADDGSVYTYIGASGSATDVVKSSNWVKVGGSSDIFYASELVFSSGKVTGTKDQCTSAYNAVVTDGKVLLIKGSTNTSYIVASCKKETNAITAQFIVGSILYTCVITSSSGIVSNTSVDLTNKVNEVSVKTPDTTKMYARQYNGGSYGWVEIDAGSSVEFVEELPTDLSNYEEGAFLYVTKTSLLYILINVDNELTAEPVQTKITIDTAVTKGSNNAVSGGAVYTALNKALNGNYVKTVEFDLTAQINDIDDLNDTSLTNAEIRCEDYIHFYDTAIGLLKSGGTATIKLIDQTLNVINAWISDKSTDGDYKYHFVVLNIEDGKFYHIIINDELNHTNEEENDSITFKVSEYSGTLTNPSGTVGAKLSDLSQNKVDKVEGKGLSTRDYDAAAASAVSSISSKADKVSVTAETETTIASLTPNTLHKWTSAITTLTITALAEPTDTTIVNEYMIEFTSGDSILVSMPSTITWMDGYTPTFSASKTYQISIINNLAVCAEF